MLLLDIALAVHVTPRPGGDDPSCGCHPESDLEPAPEGFFGTLTRSIRDAFLARQAAPPPTPPATPPATPPPTPAPQPQQCSIASPYSVACSLVGQGIEWAQGLVWSGDTEASSATRRPETPVSGGGGIGGLVSGFIGRIQEGFEQLSGIVCGSNGNVDVAAATTAISNLRKTHQDAVKAFQEHRGQLDPQQQAALLRQIEQLEERLDALENAFQQPHDDITRRMKQSCPHLCPAEDRAFEETSNEVCDSFNSRREELRELRRMIAAGNLSPEVLERFQAFREGLPDLQQSLEEAQERWRERLDQYARDIDPEAWRQVQPDIDEIWEHAADSLAEAGHALDECCDEVYASCARYCESLATQWVPMLGTVGSGPYSLSYLSFYSLLEDLLKESRPLMAPAAESAMEMTMAAVETILSEEPEETWLTSDEGESLTSTPLSTPIIGTVEEQVEQRAEETEQQRLARVLRQHGLDFIDPDQLPAWAGLVAAAPLLLAREDEQRPDAILVQEDELPTEEMTVSQVDDLAEQPQRIVERGEEDEREPEERRQETAQRRDEEDREIDDAAELEETALAATAEEYAAAEEEAARDEADAHRLIRPRPLTPRL